MRPGSACFSSCNSVLYCNNSSVNEYKWDVSSPQQLLFYRKLSDIIYDVEHTLINNDSREHNELSLLNGSAFIRKYISEYIGFLFTQKHKLEEQLTEEWIKTHNITKSEFDSISSSLNELNTNIELLINSEYVWNLSEIFWIDAAESNDSILITLKFLDVMNKFRSPLNNDGIQFDTDLYWHFVYKNAIYGKLDVVINEINSFSNDLISVYTKKLICDLCMECPLFKCLMDDDDGDDDDMSIPTKHEIIAWKKDVKRVMNQMTDKKDRLLPLLQIFCGSMNAISSIIGSDNWLDWISSYLLYNTSWIDHSNELRSLLTVKTAFLSSKKGSIEWMFGCIMSNEYSSILYYVDKIFPSWFAPHLCYFLRRSHPNIAITWPRDDDIKEMNDDYNEYILSNPKMTIIEWVFEDYVFDLLNLSNNSWIWLKNYLYFFKRRGLSMLSSVFESIDITSDKMGYLMLQTVNEFNLNDSVYNSICLRMAHKSYINNGEYGRITYWCCKCRKTQRSNNTFNMYLAHLITNYLSYPTQYINVLHDVCDNASFNNYNNNKYLDLLSKLRDMYLCRYDLQKIDIQFIKKNKEIKMKTPKATPFTKSRGYLIDALSKPYSKHNKNLKNIADSFDIIVEDKEDKDDDIKYPNLNEGPFPKSVVRRNKEIEEKASSDFLLHNLITPPRPTPSRRKKNSHRKSSHKKDKKDRKSMSMDIESKKDDDDVDDGYMTECCDIIVSYISYLIQILASQIYDLHDFIPILIFSLPILSHKYAPNAITMNNILIITHKWYNIKYNKKLTEKYANELKYINQILAHLQSKVLATTYSNKNYAQIWKIQGIKNDDEDKDQDMIDID